MNKQITIVSLLVAITVIATAYEFNDPLFNQILANELKDLQFSLEESLVHPRSRRDEEAAAEKCKSVKKRRLCCAEETFEEYHERDRELRKECYKNVTGKEKERGEFDPFKCDKVEKHRKEMTCVVQCVGQRKNVLDKDGNPKEDELVTFVKEGMSKESWFAPIQDKVISTCLAEAKNATANRDTSDSESCNPAGVKLVHCLFREIQLSCPVEQIKDQKACARVRDKIRKRTDFFHPPPSEVNEE